MVLPIRWPLLFVSLFLSLTLQAADSAAPKFPEKKIKIGKVNLTVEVAETYEQHAYGLMNRQSLADDRGMIFVFSREELREFWMKNTFIDLSIGYFDKNRILKEIIDMKATTMMQKDFPSYPSRYPAQFALEVRQGWFKKHGVKVGDKFDWR